MKIKLAQLSGFGLGFGFALALTALTCVMPAEARDNGYASYLSSGIAANSNNGGSCAGGAFQGRRGQRFNNQNMQAGIYPNYNAPFGGTANGIGNPYNNAYANNSYANNAYANNSYANSASFLNERANLQNQLSIGNLSFKERMKLQTRLAKIEAKAFSQNQGFNSFNGTGNGGLLSNFGSQYLNNNNGFLNNGLLNNNQGINGLASNGLVNSLRGRLGF